MGLFSWITGKNSGEERESLQEHEREFSEQKDIAQSETPKTIEQEEEKLPPVAVKNTSNDKEFEEKQPQKVTLVDDHVEGQAAQQGYETELSVGINPIDTHGRNVGEQFEMEEEVERGPAETVAEASKIVTEHDEAMKNEIAEALKRGGIIASDEIEVQAFENEMDLHPSSDARAEGHESPTGPSMHEMNQLINQHKDH